MTKRTQRMMQIEALAVRKLRLGLELTTREQEVLDVVRPGAKIKKYPAEILALPIEQRKAAAHRKK